MMKKYKIRSDKFSTDDINKIISEYGFEFIDFCNNSDNGRFYAKSLDGYIYLTSIYHIKRGDNHHKIHTNNIYSVYNIKIWLEKNLPQYELVSDEYKKMNSPLVFKDKDGYYYRTKFRNFEYGIIPHKFFKYNPFSIENLKLYLKKNNIPMEIIDDTQDFVSEKHKMMFRCLNNGCGHVFNSSVDSIKQGKICPICARKQVESRLATSLKNKFRENFGDEMVYFEYKLLNNADTGRWLRSDIFFKPLNMIIEINGQQHYCDDSYFYTRKNQSFDDYKRRDNMKMKYILENGLRYIEIDMRKIQSLDKALLYINEHIEKINPSFCLVA